MILFALAAVVLIGMAGLALDAGLSYMGQTGLQSASDNASLAVARMLGTDYSFQYQNSPAATLPWSYSQIVSSVNSTIAANGAGTTRATSYQAFFTTSSGGKICQFWPAAAADCGGAVPENGSGYVSAAGALVIPSNTHNTSLLGVLGIGSASETAPATAVFGLVQGGGVQPFVAYYACYEGDPSAQVPVGGIVTYFQTNHWSKDYACDSAPSSFKGDLKPGTFVIANNVAPGWASAGSGTGQLEGVNIKKGQIFLIPMIDCIAKGSWCAEPGSFSACSPTSNQALVTQVTGGWDMCVTGLISVKANAACNGPSSSPCQGTVQPFISGVGGVITCPTIAQPTCGNESGTKGATALTVELLH